MPNAKIEGTHSPIKVPSAFSPWKYSISEKIKDDRAAMNNNLSAIENFLNIFLLFIFQVNIPKYWPLKLEAAVFFLNF